MQLSLPSVLSHDCCKITQVLLKKVCGNTFMLEENKFYFCFPSNCIIIVHILRTSSGNRRFSINRKSILWVYSDPKFLMRLKIIFVHGTRYEAEYSSGRILRKEVQQTPLLEDLFMSKHHFCISKKRWDTNYCPLFFQ